MDYKALQETLSDYAKAKGTPFLWYNGSKLRDLEAKADTDKINTIWTWYEAFLPDEVLANLKLSTFGSYHYNDAINAQSAGEDCFPKYSLSPDAEHYIYACVFNANGTLAWENVG